MCSVCALLCISFSSISTKIFARFNFLYVKYIEREHFNFRGYISCDSMIFRGGSTSQNVLNALVSIHTWFDACNPNGNNFSHIHLTTGGRGEEEGSLLQEGRGSQVSQSVSDSAVQCSAVQAVQCGHKAQVPAANTRTRTRLIIH